MSTFLVSLLLGLGYNAYVVSGYASREQARCDQTKTQCPFLPPPEETPPPSSPPKTPKYQPKPPPDFSSKFLEAIEERKRQEIEEEQAQREEQRQRMIMELERPAADPYFGQRIHAWVVILPGGIGPHGPEITEPLFIEPSTGESYDPKDLLTSNLYLGIESIWNNRNYWVNMQDCTDSCSNINWNLSNVKFWEHLLPGEPKEMRDVDDDEDEEVNKFREFHMVMPASYVSKIELPYKVYERRYPHGRKIMFYKKAKVDLYAPYLRTDCMIESVTKYEEYEYKTPIYVYEKYENRGDFLVRTEKDLVKELITDFYVMGRPDACKSHTYFMNRRDLVDDERTLEFYSTKRLDDLCSIKMHPLYSTQDYDIRDDRLYHRYIEYSPINEGNAQNDIHYRLVLKILEKFHRNPKVPAKKDIAIREFDFVENEIRLTFHYNEGEYSQATRTFIKPPVTERGDRLVFLPEMTWSYNPDPLATPDDFDDLIEELEKQLHEEEASLIEVRKGETEIFEFLEIKHEEYSMPKLEISVYDPIRNQEARAGLHAQEEKKKAQHKRETEGEADFLSPYMARLGNLKYLTQKQAMQVRNDCLNDFKQVLVDRANSILREFEKYGKEMDRLQAILIEPDSLSREEKESLAEQVNDTNMKIKALEARLERHRELAPERYMKLLNTLKKNEKLSIIYENTHGKSK